MSDIQLRDTAQYTPEIVSNLTSFAYLTQPQRIVLIKMIEAMTSDLVYTDTEIAENAGVSVQTVKNCRHNAHFLSCLSQATKQFAKSEVPVFINKLKEIALSKKGSVKALDLLIRYTADFIPKSQIETENRSLNANVNLNSADALSEFVALLCDKGWNIQRIHDEVDRAYTELKQQNRVI